MLWLALLSVSQQAKADDKITVSVESRRVIDVCGQTKDQVVVVLNLGNISRSDSLFGCNFKLNYDSTKLRFHSALYLNTLAEFFEFKQVGFFSNGSIVGAVANLSMNPVSGDRPLIGFLGDYISKCPDSVEVSIDYIEFTDEFKKTVENQNGYVIAKVADKPERYFKLSVSSGGDTTLIDSLSSEASLSVKAEQGIEESITSLEMLISLKAFDNYEIRKIEPADKSILNIESIVDRNDSVIVKFFVNGKLDGKNIAIIEIAEKSKGKEIAEIQIKPLVVNNYCTCFSRLLSDKHFIASQDKQKTDTTDTTTVVNDYWNEDLIQDYYDYKNNEWVVNSSKDEYVIAIYDLRGNELLSVSGSVGISRISLDGFSTGVYYGTIRFSDKIAKKKILIKN